MFSPISIFYIFKLKMYTKIRTWGWKFKKTHSIKNKRLCEISSCQSDAKYFLLGHVTRDNRLKVHTAFTLKLQGCLLPWRYRQWILPKRRWISTRIHSVISQKAAIFINPSHNLYGFSIHVSSLLQLLKKLKSKEYVIQRAVFVADIKTVLLFSREQNETSFETRTMALLQEKLASIRTARRFRHFRSLLVPRH
jgi:hypothetical protein